MARIERTPPNILFLPARLYSNLQDFPDLFLNYLFIYLLKLFISKCFVLTDLQHKDKLLYIKCHFMFDITEYF